MKNLKRKSQSQLCFYLLKCRELHKFTKLRQDVLTDASETGIRRSAARIADAIFDKEAKDSTKTT